jgi:hypothetical protein
MVNGSRFVDLGVTRMAWVSTVAAFPLLTATEVIAGIDLTNYLLTDYKVGMTGSKSVNEMGVGDLADINVPTIKTYAGSLHLFRSLTTGTGVPATDDPLATFQGNNETGFFVRRIGPLKSMVFTTGDKVEAYKFIADSPMIDGGTGSGFLKMTVPLFSIGIYSLSITLT